MSICIILYADILENENKTYDNSNSDHISTVKPTKIKLYIIYYDSIIL